MPSRCGNGAAHKNNDLSGRLCRLILQCAGRPLPCCCRIFSESCCRYFDDRSIAHRRAPERRRRTLRASSAVGGCTGLAVRHRPGGSGHRLLLACGVADGWHRRHRLSGQLSGRLAVRAGVLSGQPAVLPAWYLAHGLGLHLAHRLRGAVGFTAGRTDAALGFLRPPQRTLRHAVRWRGDGPRAAHAVSSPRQSGGA